jgi:hypothetical protein
VGIAEQQPKTTAKKSRGCGVVVVVVVLLLLLTSFAASMSGATTKFSSSAAAATTAGCHLDLPDQTREKGLEVTNLFAMARPIKMEDIKASGLLLSLCALVSTKAPRRRSPPPPPPRES